MNAELYLQIMNNHLYPRVQQLFSDNSPVYVIEDNSSVYIARIVSEWYSRNTRLVRLPRPPRSPGKINNTSVIVDSINYIS